MRVTFFHYLHKSAGSLVQGNKFARAFRALGHEVNLHALEAAGPVRGDSKAGKPFLSRYFHEINSLKKNLINFRKECALVEKEKPDLILARYKLYRISPAWTAKRFNLPLVTWVHAPLAFEQKHYGREFVQVPGLAERVERTFLKKADGLVLVSEELEKFIPPGGQNQKRAVIPNGADPDELYPGLDGSLFRNRFPVKNPVVLGFVGSFSPWHGLKTLKMWMDYALQNFPSAVFLLAGDGPGRGELETFSRSGKWNAARVLFAGSLEHDRIPEAVAAMDICLLPYDQSPEEFYFSPLKLFEYMAAGKPVLATGIGQIPAILRDHREGLLHGPQDALKGIPQLGKLIEDASLRQRLGQAARERIRENYTWRHTAMSAAVFCQAVLEGRKAPA